MLDLSQPAEIQEFSGSSEHLLPSTLLRRQIALDQIDDSRAVGWLEDDFHYFGVMIAHDGERIVDVRSRAVRAPWNMCASAAEPLRSLIAKPLIGRATDIGALIDMRTQCTHLFDLAGLVISHISGGLRSRHYEVIVPDSAVGLGNATEEATESIADGEAGTIRLYRDDRLVTYWQVRGDDILAPPPYAGHSMGRGFRAWTETLDRDKAEQASIIRRAVLVAGARSAENGNADKPPPLTQALCHSLRPEMVDNLERRQDDRRRCDVDGRPMLTLRSQIP